MENKLSYNDLYPQNHNGTLETKLDEQHSPFKILAHPELLKKYINGDNVNPLHIRMGLTNACNIRCKFCNFHSENESSFYNAFDFKDSNSTKSIISFMHEFYENGGRAVTFCGSGECTIHPGFKEICYECKKIGLQIGIITNGIMLRHNDIRECIAKTHTWVRIGMNAGNAKTYQLITGHQNADAFSLMLDSVRYLHNNAIDKEFKIGLNFVITLDNYTEIVSATKLAKEAGADYIRFEPEFYTSLAHATIYPKLKEINHLLLEAETYIGNDFEVSIPKLDRGPMDNTNKIEGDFIKCHYCNFVTALGSDGFMYPCPQIHLNEKYRMGNAVKVGYSEWVKSGEKEVWMSEHLDRTQMCKTCFYRPQNELIEYLVTKKLDLEDVLKEYRENHLKTLHKNFV